MKLCSCLFVVLSLYFVQGAEEDADAYCVHEGVAQPAGSNWTVTGKCTTFSCDSSGNISGLGCPVFKLKAGCHTTGEDLSKPHPDCCPKPECPEDPLPSSESSDKL